MLRNRHIDPFIAGKMATGHRYIRPGLPRRSEWLELLDQERACDTAMLERVVVPDLHIGQTRPPAASHTVAPGTGNVHIGKPAIGQGRPVLVFRLAVSDRDLVDESYRPALTRTRLDQLAFVSPDKAFSDDGLDVLKALCDDGRVGRRAVAAQQIFEHVELEC